MILSLSIGKSLEEIRQMTAKDVVRYRRFYSRCPFGPARLDLTAWHTANHIADWWNGQLKPMHESVLWFGKKRKRKAKPQRNPGNTGRMMVEAELAAGREVNFYDPDGNKIPMPEWAVEIYKAGLAKHGRQD